MCYMSSTKMTVKICSLVVKPSSFTRFWEREMLHGLGRSKELLNLVTRRETSLGDAKELCVWVHLGNVQ